MAIETNRDLALEVAEQQTNQIIERLILVPLVSVLRQRLKHSPSWARYHIGTTHSEDVLHEAILFAVYDGVNDPTDLVDIALESLGHDIALTLDPDDPDFVPALPGHEIIGANFMRKKMKKHGYPEDRINVVAQSIEDTQLLPNNDGVLVQKRARHRLGRYPLDGDLSNLGREDFFEKSKLVYEELRLTGVNIERRVFDQGALDLLSSHIWQSKPARILRQPQQYKNIVDLQARLSAR